MRDEPKLENLPDLSTVNFRRRVAEPTPTPQPRDHTWQIAIGIFFGLTLFFVAYKIHERIEMNAAIAEFNRQMTELSKPDADPYGWQAQTATETRRRAAQDRALYELQPGERCIQGRRFRRIQNGWEQVNRPCR